MGGKTVMWGNDLIHKVVYVLRGIFPDSSLIYRDKNFPIMYFYSLGPTYQWEF